MRTGRSDRLRAHKWALLGGALLLVTACGPVSNLPETHPMPVGTEPPASIKGTATYPSSTISVLKAEQSQYGGSNEASPLLPPAQVAEVVAAATESHGSATAAVLGMWPRANEPTAPARAEQEALVRTILRGRPLEPYSAEIVAVAGSYGVDPLLMAAIAIWESGGGANACGGNAWGLGSCAPGYQFATFSEGIEAVAATLASPGYAGLGPRAIACRWVSGDASCPNEHSIAYAGRVLTTMGKQE